MGPNRRRSTLTALALAACCALASPAQANWRSMHEVALGTAQVLQKGELTFGVVSPIAYGLTDNLTVQSHPIFDLLLLPNLGARLRAWSSRGWVISGVAQYKQHIELRDDDLRGGPGEVLAGGMLTRYFGDHVALTASGAWSYAKIVEVGDDVAAARYTRGIATNAQLHVLVDHRHLIRVDALARYDAELARWNQPIGSLSYVRAWDTFHLVVGLSVGQFPMRPFTGGETLRAWPVMPLVDLWWRM